MKIYYDKDTDAELIKKKKVTIVGYGSQGNAHANNLKDSGVDITVALRKASLSWPKAEQAGLPVKEVEEAVKAHPAITDCLVVSAPDDRFGYVVAVSGNTIITRAYKDDEDENGNNYMNVDG